MAVFVSRWFWVAIYVLNWVHSAACLIHRRGFDGPLLASYDYIICGCGVSGLVMARRLSEDQGVTVLCIEAGPADQYEPEVLYPVYVGEDIGGKYDWNLATVPQAQLDGSARAIPQGKVLGGGSILNGMVWHRAGADDYDAWNALGATGWAWSDLLPYFIKSENFTPVSDYSLADTYSIHSNPSVHGFNGPVSVSYPNYLYPQSVNFFDGLTALGIPTAYDPNEGYSVGAAFLPQDLSPWNQTRSDARITYFDPSSNRTNLDVVVNQHVTRVILNQFSDQSPGRAGPGGTGTGPEGTSHIGLGFDIELEAVKNKGYSQAERRQTGSLRATGVEFAADDSSPRQLINATREVILAAGALHTTQILQLSGIGPTGVLQQYNITVAVDLPGVGNNLQDHPLVATYYPYNNATYPLPTTLLTNASRNAAAEQEYLNNRTGPWTAGAVDALAFLSLPSITDLSEQIIAAAIAANATSYLPANLTDPALIAGYQQQRASILDRLGTGNTPAVEVINNNAGSLTVALMHPLSRGTCSIGSSDPFMPPVVDPRWLSDPTDRAVLLEALLFNRQILATPTMQQLQPAQFIPPLNATEAQLQQMIDDGVETEFHVSGTAAMLPQEIGGVVDTHCRVYGVPNLRVVDASIFPLIPGGHLQAVVYAVAEKAADIIKADDIGVTPVPPSPGEWTRSSARTQKVPVAQKGRPIQNQNVGSGNASTLPPNIPGWFPNEKQLDVFLQAWANSVRGD